MKPWTEKHRREALRAMLMICYGHTFDRPGDVAPRSTVFRVPVSDADSEESFRAALATAMRPVRIDREVRRVRALAEGRLVREERWHVGACVWDNETDARTYARECRRRFPRTKPPVVRVTRIRRP